MLRGYNMKKKSAKKRVKRPAHSKQNNMVLSLLVATLILSAVGTFVSVSQLMGLDFFIPVGASIYNDTGLANLSITSLTAVTNQVSVIDFGSGYVNASCMNCTMDSDSKHNQTGPCCIGFYNVTNGFLLENTGNVNISLNYTCVGNCTAATFIGGTDPHFEIRALPNLNASQSGEGGTTDTAEACWDNMSTSYRDVTAEGHWLCGDLTHFNLSYANEYDAIVVDLNVTIPQDAPSGAGESNATFRFNAFG